MAKTKISEYSSTANSNTDIASINIDEGCAPSGINNAIRALMAQLKDFQTGAASDPVTVGGVLTVTGGSASAPAITTSGDTNTGVLFPAADTVGITTGGTERVRVDSSGNVGVGATPAAWQAGAAIQMQDNVAYSRYGYLRNAYFDGSAYKYNTTGAASLYLQAAGAHQWFYAASGSAGASVSFAESMRIDSSGNVGIGTSSPATRLSIDNTYSDTAGSGFLTYTSVSNTGGRRGLRVNTNNAFCFDYYNGSSWAQQMALDSSGNLLVGTTSTFDAAAKLQIQNTGTNTLAATKAGSTSATAAFGFYNPNGLVGSIQTSGSATSYVTSSDYRLKENIAPMTGALEKIVALKPCTYTWKTDGSDGQGFIAHELAEVVPDCVTGEKDATRIEQYEISPAVPATFDEEGNELTPAIEAVTGEREVPVYQGIDTSFLVATLTAAIQEQQALITQLQADVAALKGQA